MSSPKNSTYSSKLFWLDYHLLILVIIWIALMFRGAPPSPLDIRPLHLLTSVASKSFAGNGANVHNSVLLSVLQQKSANETIARETSEGGTNQARIIFVTFLAALVTLASKLAADKINSLVYTFFLFLIALMFFLDVQHEDSRNISHAHDVITDIEIQKLANANTSDTTWYDLSYDAVNPQFQALYSWPDRWVRKSTLVCQPNPERVIFYVLPWFLVYYFARPTFRGRSSQLLRANASRDKRKAD